MRIELLGARIHTCMAVQPLFAQAKPRIHRRAKSRFPEETRESRALTGQKRVHHFRNSVTSNSRIAGNTTRPHVVSLKANRCQMPIRTVSVRPMGHTRQNTGKPKMALDPRAPASTKCRLSRRRPSRAPPIGERAFPQPAHLPEQATTGAHPSEAQRVFTVDMPASPMTMP